MKYFIWFIGFLLTLLLLIYILGFTPFGNKIVAPYIQTKIQQSTHLDSKLTRFSLSMSSIDVLLDLDSQNSVALSGDYSLFSQSLDILYRVELENLKSLKALVNAPIQGILHTNGTIKGDKKLLNIDGLSDIASSETDYHIELRDFNPSSIIAEVKSADLGKLLYLGAQKPYANAEINLNINFKNITPHQLDGTVLLNTKNGLIDTELMKKDFNITLPQTAFSMNMDAKLQGDDITYSYLLDSNLAKLASSGKVIPLPLALDIVYDLNIEKLALLQPITQTPLRGKFATDGVVKGNQLSMLIDGKSDLAQSQTLYKIDLKEFKPLSVLATIKGAKLNKLLDMLGQPAFASSDIDADIKLTSLDPNNLAGNININLSDGVLNSQVMKSEYKVNLPKTTFMSKISADLKGESLEYTTKLASNLADLQSSGNITPKTMAMDLIYNLDIKELAALKPITGADLRGSFDLKGDVKGDKNNLSLSGSSNFSSSQSSFDATLQEFVPVSLKAKMSNLQLSKVLYLLNQPHYADALISLNVDILDAREGQLNGKISSKLENGVLNSAFLTKEYEFKTKMPQTTFTLDTSTKLNGEYADTKLNFDSSLATFDIAKARVNLKDGTLVSDYIAKIPNLDSLYFATDRHMRGALSVDGELQKAKDLDLSMHSKLAGGKFDANLHNDDFHADLKSMQTLDLLHMLIYPEMFKSTINAKIDYNLLSKKGQFNADLADGTFTQNQMLTLVKQYGKLDLYSENFNGDIKANINKENILASMNLKSRVSSIKTTNTKLNSKTKEIDSLIEISANNNPITVTLKGDATAPKVGVDVEDLVKKEATKAIQKEVGKLFKGLF